MSEDFDSSSGSSGGGGGSYSETSFQSWGDRIVNAFKGILVGLVLILVSLVVLFLNEGSAVDTARALAETGANVATVSPTAVDPANENKLVHVTGNLVADEKEDLTDDMFGVQAKGMIRLERTVKRYQWKENVKEETSRQGVGGQKTKKTYTYEKVWEDHRIDSSNFNQAAEYQNPLWPDNMSSKVFTAQKVTLGAFTVPAALLKQVHGSTSLPLKEQDASHLPDAVKKDFRVDAGSFYKGKGSDAN